MPSSTSDAYHLTQAQKDQFLEHGFIKITNCFSRQQATEFTSELWTRLGMDPNDKSTWHTERTNMAWHKHVSVADFAPKAWSAMCELLGGEERISDNQQYKSWGDGFIVNLGKKEYEGEQEQDLRALDGWHNDGDFFTHFLDSPEQALLVIPLWSDIKPKAGGTAICLDGMKYIAQHLYEHPEGTNPWMQSIHEPTATTKEGREFWQSLAWDRTKCRDETFLEMTGEVGDVILMHPLMLHSASKNLLRISRVITNPPVSLKEPFNFDRQNPEEYSLVELKTLKDLGKPEGLKGWKIESERRPWISQRTKRRELEKIKEIERLKATKGPEVVDVM